MPSTDLLAERESAIAATATEAVAQVATAASSFGESHRLAVRLRELAQRAVAHGDACPLPPDEDVRDLECRLTHFVWAERAKHFLLLYRDVQLQLQTADLLIADGQAEAELVDRLHSRSEEILREALREWETEVAEQRAALERDPTQRRRQLDRWALLHNPWPVYRQQLLTIAEQGEELAEEHGRLRTQTELFAGLRERLREGIAAAREQLEETTSRAREIADFILVTAAENDQLRPGKIASRLEDYVTDGGPAGQLHGLTTRLAEAINQLVAATRVTVGTDHGILQYKDVNFRRATDQWVSAEVLPLLYELWELAEQVTNNLNVATANVRNRALLLSNEVIAGKNVVYDALQLSQPFDSFLAKADQRRTEFAAIEERLRERVERDLRLTAVYRPVAGFLPLPLQTGINEFTRRQGKVLDRVREWLGRHIAGLEQLRGDAAREENLSVAERTVRVVRQRVAPADNSAYTNILMTKGYIGESFLVGRDTEIAHVRQLVGQWREGFRGAVVLTGRRLTGKTLFGELIANRFFPNNTIRLRPHSTINVEGRRLKVEGTLAPALAFIEKYTLQRRPLVWIDDLETWWDKDTALAANVRALTEHIDDYSGRIFYLVATTNAVYHHLNRFRELDRIFQSEVNLDDFDVEDMQRAILIRHGATHKTIVDAEGEPLSEAAFAQLVKQMHRASHGVVGDTLNRWAYFTQRYDEERVTPYTGRRYQLPTFLATDTGILLTTVFLEKRTKEYRLRRLFGPDFQDHYRSILQRLSRVGLLSRHNDGWLEITESVVNDVGRLLAEENYLTHQN